MTHEPAPPSPDDLIADIQYQGFELTDWEREFVEGVANQRLAGHTLSDRQIEILEQIHDERVEPFYGLRQALDKDD